MTVKQIVKNQFGATHVFIAMLFSAVIAAVGVSVYLSTHPYTMADNTAYPAVITVGNGYNGKSLTMHAGQKLVVQLSNQSVMRSESTNPKVLSFLSVSQLSPTSLVPDGTVVTNFKAVAAGSSDLQINTTMQPHCSAHEACPMYIALYRFNLNVNVDKDN